MSIYEALHADHDRAEALFEELLETSNDEVARRQEVFGELRRELETHAAAEEALFYTRLESQEGIAEVVAELLKDHDEIRGLLKELGADDMSSDAWMEKLDILMEIVQKHVEEEETEAFDLARAILDESEGERLEEEFLARRDSLSRSAAPG